VTNSLNGPAGERAARDPRPVAPSPTAATAPSTGTGSFQALVIARDWGIVILLIILLIAFSIWGAPIFATLTNFGLIVGGAAVSALFAASIAVGVLSGSLDLSVPGTAALGSILTGVLVVDGVPSGLALLAGLAIGVVVGLVNGFVAVLGVNALAVTIGTLSVTAGIAAVISGGNPVSGLDPLHYLGTDLTFGLPAPVYVVVIVYVLFTIFLTKTRTGVRLMAVGGNAEALRRSGVSASRYRILGFVLSGLLASLAGIVSAASTTEATPSADTSVLFTGLTAVALSGLALSGGRGSLPKVLVGALVIASISSILVIKNVQPYWTTVITGALLIIALAGQLVLGRALSARAVTRR
jgi:ribose transport system permease protein